MESLRTQTTLLRVLIGFALINVADNSSASKPACLNDILQFILITEFVLSFVAHHLIGKHKMTHLRGNKLSPHRFEAPDGKGHPSCPL